MAYREPARTATRRIQIRRTRVAGLLVVVAAMVSALGYRSLSSSSSMDASPVDVLHNERGGALPSTVWPVSGQAAFVETGQA